MKSSKGSELTAGIFVLVMIAAFILFLSYVGGTWARILAPKNDAVTWFRNIGGLKNKVQVVYQGYRIGEVSNIAYENDSALIRVEMKLDADFPLPQRGIATISSASLLTDPYIEITTEYDPKVRRQLVRRDDRIVTAEDGTIYIDALNPQSFGMLQAKLGALLDDANVSLNSITDSLGRVLTGANLLISDPVFRADIHAAAANLRIASEELPMFVASASSAAGRVDRLIARSEDTVASIISNVDEMTVNTRVLTYGLTAKPSMLVWGDKEWEARVKRRDPELLTASLRSPLPSTVSASVTSETRPPRRRPGTSYFGN